jgi:hypothetical protein
MDPYWVTRHGRSHRNPPHSHSNSLKSRVTFGTRRDPLLLENPQRIDSRWAGSTWSHAPTWNPYPFFRETLMEPQRHGQDRRDLPGVSAKRQAIEGHSKVATKWIYTFRLKVIRLIQLILRNDIKGNDYYAYMIRKNKPEQVDAVYKGWTSTRADILPEALRIPLWGRSNLYRRYHSTKKQTSVKGHT